MVGFAARALVLGVGFGLKRLTLSVQPYAVLEDAVISMCFAVLLVSCYFLFATCYVTRAVRSVRISLVWSVVLNMGLEAWIFVRHRSCCFFFMRFCLSISEGW